MSETSDVIMVCSNGNWTKCVLRGVRRPSLDGAIGRGRDDSLIVITQEDIVAPVGVGLDTLPEGGGREVVAVQWGDLKSRALTGGGVGWQLGGQVQFPCCNQSIPSGRVENAIRLIGVPDWRGQVDGE